MRSIRPFVLGLSLMAAGMLTVGAGVAHAQVGNTKADACLLRLKNTTINLEHIVYITIGGASSIEFWYAGNSSSHVTVGSADVASDLSAYTARMRNCINSK